MINKFKYFFKKYWISTPFKVFIFLLIGFFLFAIVLFGSTHKPFQKIFWYTRILQLLRKNKILTTTEKGFFEALKSQNLLYDFNNDGFVTGLDYSLMLAEQKEGVLPEMFVTTTSSGSEGDNGQDRSNISLPSVKGFSTNEFDGSANVDYAFDLPVGPGGLTPKLALSYSSSSVDDMQVGVHTGYRYDPLNSYQRQAGLVGLGWDLSGISSISRDFNDTMKDPTDDKFIISFEGGSANLVKESGDDNFSIWRTTPNLNIKIERYGKCYPIKLFSYPNCRYHWVVTTGSGDKYFFGSDNLVTYDKWAHPKDPDKANISPNNNWYQLFEKTNGVYFGTCEWITLMEKSGRDTVFTSLPSKWLLSRVESKYYKTGVNDAKIDYKYLFDIGQRIERCEEKCNQGGEVFLGTKYNVWYPRAVYPYKINYGNHLIEFVLEDRLDYKIHSNVWKYPVQPLVYMKRLKKIIISSLNKVRNVYKFEYEYGWRPKDHMLVPPVDENAPPDVGYSCQIKYDRFNKPIIKDGQTIHSLLRSVTEFDQDPDTNLSAKRKPSNTFYYGQNCNDYCGGCPLTSFAAENQLSFQIQTPNDFFLLSADNGSGGKTTFEYWNNGTGDNAIPVQYCYNKNNGTSICNKDVVENTQRHRVISKTVEDGMGNYYKVGYNYLGDGSSQGLAYVENPFTQHCHFEKTEDETRCASLCSIDASKRICKCSPQCNSAEYRSTDLPGYEFLGYPEVETITYQKNSTTEIAAKSKNSYYQAMRTSSCFRPSPLKGTSFKNTIYDTTNPARFSESINRYKVRFGKMFGQTTEIDDANLFQQCPIYDPKTTVSLVLSTESISKDYINNAPVLCTKNTRSYAKLDGSQDPYAQLRKEIAWGKVDCNDSNKDIDDGTPIISIQDYTQGKNDIAWRVPLPNESWSQGYQQTEKYNHSKTYYDNLLFGQIGDYGNATKTEILVNGTVNTTFQNSYDTSFPWLLTQSIDSLGRTTKTEYDSIFHMHPVKVINPIGQTDRTEYDFTIADKTHPNYQGNKGLPVKTIDNNNQETILVYDAFSRVLDTYLPGRKPGSSKASTSNRYYYFNENDISPCDVNTNCLSGLGKSVYGKSTPKLIVAKTTRMDDAGTVGNLSASYSFYNGIGQLIQTRTSWYAGEFANAGIPVEGEGNKDLISSKLYNALGSVDVEALAYTDTSYVPGSPNPYQTRDFVSDASIKKITTTYDGLGRVVKTTSPDGTFVQTDHDVDNNPLKTRILDKNCTDNNPATLCAQGIVIKDAFGRILEQQTIDTQTNKIYSTKSEYHPILGSVTKTIDTLGNTVSTISYDLLGRKISMLDIDMGNWKYEYDVLGNLTRQTDAKGQVSELTYDTLNRITFKKTQGKTILENQYDNCTLGVGKLCKTVSYDTTDNKPIYTKSQEYDNRSRAKKETITLSNLPDNIINKSFSYEYTYDESGRVVTVKTSGLKDLELPEENQRIGYNRSHLTTLSGASNYQIDARYNKDGQIVLSKTGDNTTQNYLYDDNTKRLKTYTLTGSTNIASLSYQYDSQGAITNIQDSIRASSDPFSLAQSFAYDVLKRLTSVAGAYQASYTYDDLDNIMTKNEGGQQVALKYGDVNSGYYHRPQVASVTSLESRQENKLAYDVLGNLTNYQDSQYIYDTENRMIKANFSSAGKVLAIWNNIDGGRRSKPIITPRPRVTAVKVSPTRIQAVKAATPTLKPGIATIQPTVSSTPTPVDSDQNTIRFYYTADGQRIAKIDPSTANTYYISPDLEIVVKKDGSVFWRKNYFVDGKLVSVRTNEASFQENPIISYFIHSDHLGSTSWILDETGKVVSEERYYPYGNTRHIAGNSLIERKFTGQVSDVKETGLYYYNARYYNPIIAKFTQADSINDQLNRYAYVGNNPVNATDPTGNMMDKGGDDGEEENYPLPWDDPEYSYKNTGMDPMLSFLYKNPNYDLTSYIAKSGVDYSSYDMDAILGDYLFHQNMVRFNLGLLDDPFAGNLGTMIKSELISMIPAGLPMATKMSLAFFSVKAKSLLGLGTNNSAKTPVSNDFQLLQNRVTIYTSEGMSPSEAVGTVLKARFAYQRPKPGLLRPLFGDPATNFVSGKTSNCLQYSLLGKQLLQSVGSKGKVVSAFGGSSPFVHFALKTDTGFIGYGTNHMSSPDFYLLSAKLTWGFKSPR